MGQSSSNRANTGSIEGSPASLTPRFQLSDIGFNQIISALSSNQRVEANDPRWKYLFNPDILLDLLTHPYCISEHALRMIQNNPSTRNLIALIDQINHQLSFLLRSRGNLPEDIVNQTCVSLALLTNILHYFFMFTNTEELRKQLDLPAHWPEGRGQTPASPPDTLPAMERLLENMVACIHAAAEEMTDVKFFILTLFLTLHSCSIYKDSAINPQDHVCTEDIFSQYLFQIAVKELQAGLKNFNLTDSLPYKLLRGLVCLSLGGVVVGGTLPPDPSAPDSLPLRRVTQGAYSLNGFVSNLHFRIIAFRSGYEGEGDVVKSMSRWIMGLLSHVPLLNNLLPPISPTDADDYDPQDLSVMNDIFDASLVPPLMLPIHLLKDRAVQLMLFLVFRQCEGMNPFREVFNMLVDDQYEAVDGGDVEMVSRGGGAGVGVGLHVDFEHILEEITKCLPAKEYVLLLYALLRMPSPPPLHRTNHAHRIYSALLKGLYEAVTGIGSGTNAEDGEDEAEGERSHIYTMLICMLMLVQEEEGFSHISHLPLDLSYYAPLKPYPNIIVSTCHGTVIVLTKVLSVCTYNIQDSYICTNVSAILMNMAGCMSGGEVAGEGDVGGMRGGKVYMGERLVRGLLGMGKKILKEMKADQGEDMGVDVDDIEVQGAQQSASHASGAGAHAHTTSPYSSVSAAVPGTDATAGDSVRIVRPLDVNLLRDAYTTLLQLLSSVLGGSGLGDNLTVFYPLLIQWGVGVGGEGGVLRKQWTGRGGEVLQMFLRGEGAGEKGVEYLQFLSALVAYYAQKLERGAEAQVQSSHGSPEGGEEAGSVNHYHTAEQAMQFIRNEITLNATSQGGSVDAAAPPTLLSFRYDRALYTYQEGENAQAFFVPYIWTTILLSTPDLPWHWEKLNRVQEVA